MVKDKGGGAGRSSEVTFLIDMQPEGFLVEIFLGNDSDCIRFGKFSLPLLH